VANVSTLSLFPSREAGLFGRRLKRSRGTRIPVYVVTGFLGAGKTTLVREFLKTPEGANTAIVINEFGAVGIDDALVRAATEEKTVLLGNGCVCCNTRSDLQIALRGLVADRERGAIPHFKRIVIETSGLADPGPILQTFASDRALGSEFHVEATVALVDAESAADTLGWSVEARKQVILADRLVVTKTDLAPSATVGLLKRRLAELNPHAAIETAVNGVIDPRLLFANDDARPDDDRNAFVAEAAHSDGIRSFVWTETVPIAWDVFARGMETLTALRGPDLLRAKGFLNVAGCAGPVVVQVVQHLMHPPVELQTWPDTDRTTRIVFITRNIPEQTVRDLFTAVRALEPEKG
jgi:G3E family GTPase